ncbi:c-type cytochrome [Gangjinia marincola]|uniref:C-type cytochrome n=1 Tax=Gangjinia marincola TaxID=578463 RepID=A0ABN1MEG9_9FLAO
MNRQKNHWFVTTISSLFLVALIVLSPNTFAQEIEAGETPAVEEAAVEAAQEDGNAENGEKLFKSLCAACHKRYQRATGPALYGVTERRSKEWLYKWIVNSAEMIASGDAQAVALYEEYGQSNMNAFPQLSNEDIDDILAYVMIPQAPPEEKVITDKEVVPVGGVSTNLVLGILAFVLLMLIVILVLVNKTLQRFAEASGVELAPVQTESTGKPIWKAFVENQFLVFASTVVLLLASAYFAYGYLMQVGVDQGYAPIQPIHYSHKIHAGINKIECKYCHSSARVSKHSGIPSLNVCMNCHKQIAEYNGPVTDEYSKEFYDNEIQKLYAATGWDPSTQKYTGETKPVKWVRIHNLPDFAYFNHAQHVMVGQIDCQKCHGEVEEMEIMYQYSPLTMGWCINCHRETNIKVEGNEYYEKIHAELSKKYGVDKLTAAEMGGLECGKCHY